MIRRLFVFPVFPPEAKERACQTWLGKRELVLRKVILVDASLEGRIQFFSRLDLLDLLKVLL